MVPPTLLKPMRDATHEFVFIRRSHLLSQVQNYNHALKEISAASQYCKIVQADDFIFPDCLRLMAKAFEQSPTIGLVSAYDMKGKSYSWIRPSLQHNLPLWQGSGPPLFSQAFVHVRFADDRHVPFVPGS